jgi:hypothetical protein
MSEKFKSSGLDIPPECDPVVVPVMDAKAYKLSAAQIKMADLIVKKFVKAGFGYPVAAAAVANAFRESSFNPREDSDPKSGNPPHGKYIGLFQLGPHILAGVEDRMDPHKNIDAMIAYTLKRPKFLKIARMETDIPTLAREFCILVEAPEDTYCEADIREEIANKLFPLDFSENDPAVLTPAIPEECLVEEEDFFARNKNTLGLVGAGLILFAAGAIYLRVKHNIPARPPRRELPTPVRPRPRTRAAGPRVTRSRFDD